jgi:ABC-type amino acid transport substrate-binding protein
MANNIAGKLGAKVETLESTWGNQIPDLQAEKIDLAFAVSPTPERRRHPALGGTGGHRLRAMIDLSA